MKKIILVTLCMAAILLSACSKTTDTYVQGTVTDNGFESEWMNMKFTLPEGWVIASQEEMDEVLATGEDALNGEVDTDAAMEDSTYEMMTYAEAGLPSVSIMVEKLPSSKMTIEEYADVIKEGLNNSTGTYVWEEPVAETVAGEEYQNYSGSVELYGVTVKQDYIFRKLENRIIGIIITYTDDVTGEVDNFLSGIAAY